MGNQILSEKAYYLLRNMIMNLQIPPKEPLSELRLSVKLGMSRTPVREAIRRLNHEGIIAAYKNRGYVINIPNIKEIKDLYELRILLEGGAARLAAAKIDSDRLGQFEREISSFRGKEWVLKQQRKKEGRHNVRLDETGRYDFVDLGRKFHFFIIETTGNEKLIELMKGIYAQLDLTRVLTYTKRSKEAISEHLRIISALKKRDSEKSERFMVEHLNKAFHELTKIL